MGSTQAAKPLRWTAGIAMIAVLIGLSAVGLATQHPAAAGTFLGVIVVPVVYLILPRVRRGTESSASTDGRP